MTSSISGSSGKEKGTTVNQKTRRKQGQDERGEESRRRVSAARFSCAAGARSFRRGQTGTLPRRLNVLQTVILSMAVETSVYVNVPRGNGSQTSARAPVWIVVAARSDICSDHARCQQSYCPPDMPDIMRMVKRRIHDNFAIVLFRPVFQKITQPDA
jgi:hypothetical protein